MIPGIHTVSSTDMGNFAVVAPPDRIRDIKQCAW